jgi:Uri superfamily endonuclease
VKGTYILLLELPNDEEIIIGKLGEIKFRKGFYAYVGSALNGLEKRIERHLRKRKKKMHWHIDYFLKKATVKEVFYVESKTREECNIVQKLAKKFSGIKKFGCSDCNCESHLFYSENFKSLLENAKKGFSFIAFNIADLGSDSF